MKSVSGAVLIVHRYIKAWQQLVMLRDVWYTTVLLHVLTRLFALLHILTWLFALPHPDLARHLRWRTGHVAKYVLRASGVSPNASKKA